MKRPLNLLLACGALWCAGANHALGVQTCLALRVGDPMGIYHSSTKQIVLPTFGTNMATLQFPGTTTYDFFTPPLAADTSLVPSDKGGGVIYMQNTSTDSTHDFSVSGRMQFFDYDPTTGTETLIVDTTASPHKDVNHGQTVNWAIPNALLPVSTTLVAGHMIHIAMTIGLVSGDPGGFGAVVYNGPNGPSTSGLLPQNRSTVLAWSFNPPPSPTAYSAPPPPPTLSISVLGNGQTQISCAGLAGRTYSLQATTNLVAPVWVNLITTNAALSGVFSFVDQDAPLYPCRFYRGFAQ